MLWTQERSVPFLNDMGPFLDVKRRTRVNNRYIVNQLNYRLTILPTSIYSSY